MSPSLIGVPLGLLAGFRGGIADEIVMRCADTVLAFPGIVLAVGVVAMLGPGLTNAMVAVGIVFAPSLARLMRAQVLGVKEHLYVEAAITFGGSPWQIIRRHIVPNSIQPVIVQTSLLFAAALLAEAGLSFIGLGVQPPDPSWGSMLGRAYKFMRQAPLQVVAPGADRDVHRAGVQRHRRLAARRARPHPTAPAAAQAGPTAGDGATNVSDEVFEGANDRRGVTEVLASVADLTIAFGRDGHEVRPVEGMSFEIGAGERLGMVGESGSGKSLSSLAMLGLITGPGLKVSGTLEFDGRRYDLGSPELRRLRGREISMIFQEPMTALDPVFTVGHQLREAIRRHHKVSRAAGKRMAIEALAAVGIPDPDRRYGEYPHQLSRRHAPAGDDRHGDRVRAQAAPRRRADDGARRDDAGPDPRPAPRAQRERGMAILLVSHDLGVIADLCDRVVCVYAGQVVEDTSLEMALRHPSHPYLEGLLQAMPRVGGRGTRLAAIPGAVPVPGTAPVGCRFRSRCAYAQDVCAERQVLLPSRTGGLVRCVPPRRARPRRRGRVTEHRAVSDARPTALLAIIDLARPLQVPPARLPAARRRRRLARDPPRRVASG